MMSTKAVALLCLALFLGEEAAGVCPNDNNLRRGSFTMPAQDPSEPLGPVLLDDFAAGDYVVVGGLVAGKTYTLSTCGSSFDTVLTVYDAVTGAVLGYNDDSCGLQSTVMFISNAGNDVRMVADEFPCEDSGNLLTIRVATSTDSPTPSPTPARTSEPTAAPTQAPTAAPTQAPTIGISEGVQGFFSEAGTGGVVSNAVNGW